MTTNFEYKTEKKVSIENGKPKGLSSKKVWFSRVASSIITNVYALNDFVARWTVGYIICHS